MQRYAFDENGLSVCADGAKSRATYYCPTCSEPLRLKRGSRRRAHFFHLARTPACRLSEKTYLHALIQEWLFERLPGEEKYLERPFPRIGRIADLASFDLRAVFEVQISKITPQEMAARRDDYAREALSTVWILHERRFKEINYPIYYLTDIDDEGRGSVYDPKTGLIDITCPLYLDAPLGLFQKGQIYFRGDRIWEMLAGRLPLPRGRYYHWLLSVAKSLAK